MFKNELLLHAVLCAYEIVYYTQGRIQNAFQKRMTRRISGASYGKYYVGGINCNMHESKIH
jgi:hypothetical protein